MKNTITISDLEVIREAVIRFYDSSDYSNRKELVTELRKWKPWIDPDGRAQDRTLGCGGS